MHARSYSKLFLHKYIVIFRVVRYVSGAANFELTEINNTLKCLGVVAKLKVRTLRWSGYLENVRKHTRGVAKSMKLGVCTL